MNVELVSWSQPSPKMVEQGITNVQELIAYKARVSNPSNQYNTLTSEKLLKYLIREHHWSPFEMTSVALELETTRDIAHQIVRHRSFSFQEFSQRYAEPRDLGDIVFREARAQDDTNRQNSIDVVDPLIKANWEVMQKQVAKLAADCYDQAIDMGIAKEQARCILPEGLTPTKLYMNGNIRSWIHYIELRSEHGTQKEHIEIARACGEAIKPIFPMIEEFIHYDA